MPTDLLDMFKGQPTRGSSPARATSRTRPDAGRGQGGYAKKQLALAGTVMVLLMALAFTAGVGVGRNKRGQTESAALAAPVKAQTSHWGIRSKTLPSTGAKTENLQLKMARDLNKRWPELSLHVTFVDALDKNNVPKPGQFRIIVKDFDSRDDAKSVEADLSVWAVDGILPFENCRAERME